MYKSKIEHIKKTENVLSAFMDNMPIDVCIKKIDELIHNDESKINDTACMNFIHWAAKTFYDKEKYSVVFKYLEDSGMLIANLSNDIAYYWIEKYLTGDDKLKKIAVKQLLKINHLSNIIFDDYLYLLRLKTNNIQIIKQNIFKEYGNRQNEMIYEYLYYFITEKNTDMIKLNLDCGFNFDINLILKIMLEQPELYYDYIGKNFFDAIPSLFKIKGKKLRSIENLIPFLFKSKKFENYLNKDENYYYYYDTIYVIFKLYYLLDKDTFKKISEYFPTILFIPVPSAIKLVNADDEIFDVIFSKAETSITLYGKNLFNRLDISALKKLKKKLKGKKLSATLDFLESYSNPSDIIKIIDLFDNNVFKFFDSDDDYYKKIIDYDNKQLTEKAVECRIFDFTCYEDAIEYAVENKKYNALDILRLNFSKTKELDEPVWGTFTDSFDE